MKSTFELNRISDDFTSTAAGRTHAFAIEARVVGALEAGVSSFQASSSASPQIRAA